MCARLTARKGAKIDALYVGNMSAGRFIEQEHIGALIADYSGLARDHIPATRVEAAGASGGLALRQGFLAVASGLHDIVVVGGAEKMMDVSDVASAFIQSSAADQEWETELGATFPSLHALIARRHMHEHGTTREQMADVAVKNHRHGSMNPKAQFQREITRETVTGSPLVASPLKVFDCAPSSDGAAAVVLCPLDQAKKYTDRVMQSAPDDHHPALPGWRLVTLPGGPAEIPLHWRPFLKDGFTFAGPALILEAFATHLVLPGFRGEVAAGGHLVLKC